jgi:hypothetical protein
MTNRIFPFILILVAAILLTSCNRPACVNSNPIFEEFNMDSEEYLTELLFQIDKQSKDKLSYWFESYKKINEKEFIIVKVQNNELCVKTIMRVHDWKGLEGIGTTQGKGYSGAELKGLKFLVDRDSSHTFLVYNGVDRIID